MEMCSFTIDELYTHANSLCQKHWGVNYTGTIELVARDWKSRVACFCHDPYNQSFQQILMSSKKNAKYSDEKVLATLLHELVHWRLYTTGKPHSDEDEPFIAECIRVGAVFSKTGVAQKAYQHYQQKRAYEQRTGRKYDEEDGINGLLRIDRKCLAKRRP